MKIDDEEFWQGCIDTNRMSMIKSHCKKKYGRECADGTRKQCGNRNSCYEECDVRPLSSMDSARMCTFFWAKKKGGYRKWKSGKPKLRIRQIIGCWENEILRCSRICLACKEEGFCSSTGREGTIWSPLCKSPVRTEE